MYDFSLAEAAFIGAIVLLDLFLLVLIATAIVGLVGVDRLARWLRLDVDQPDERVR